MPRATVLVGHIGPSTRGEREIATYCAWGKHWFSDEDRRRARHGAVLSHGCCPDCRHLLWDPPPEAA